MAKRRISWSRWIQLGFRACLYAQGLTHTACPPLFAQESQASAPLRVRLEAQPGPFYVGEGIDLMAGVVHRDTRPALERPNLAQADCWMVDAGFKPLSVGGIGAMVAGENLFLTRLRVVPRRAGVLEIPPLVARSDGQTGRSRALRLTIEPVPSQGRPAHFLGGVGQFTLRASAAPATVRVGQEILYRIEILGPAAWGSTARPALDRLERGPLAPRITPLPDELVNEPPSRSFLYRIRPTSPGTASLPPVSIAAFDPESRRFVTRVTEGLPVQAVALPTYNPGGLDYAAPAPSGRWNGPLTWALAALAVVGAGLALGGGPLRRRWRAARQAGPRAARRLAARTAADLKRQAAAPDGAAGAESELARRLLEALIAYGRLGTGRPPGALTPPEARSCVLQLTGSEPLASQAEAVAVRCDQVLFSERAGGASAAREEPEPLRDQALPLFEALGRVRPEHALSARPSRETA